MFRSLSKIFEKLGRTLTGLKFLAWEGFSFFNIGVTSASFNSFGNSALIKQLLNIVFNVSEQMVLVDFRSFWWILFDVVAFLGLIRFSCLSISDKPISLNEKLGIFLNLLLISKTLGWFLYLFTAFSTELISLLSLSMI